MTSNVARTKRAAKMTNTSRKSTTKKSTVLTAIEVEEYFDYLRREYSQGMLSERLVTFIEDLLPGFFAKCGVQTRKLFGNTMSMHEIQICLAEARSLSAADKLPLWQVSYFESILGSNWNEAE